LRVVALDLGTRRIGVAVSDPGGRLATPVKVVERSGDLEHDRRVLAELVDELEAERVVIGLPLSLDGSLGPAARAALEETDALGAHLSVPVETYDERFTTVTADHLLSQQKRNARERRKSIDMAAAAVLLQAWLDGHRDQSSPTTAADPAESP
jgi:putative Holliday junction resolvase